MQPLAPNKDAYRSGFADLSGQLLNTIGSPAMRGVTPKQDFDMTGLAQDMGRTMASPPPQAGVNLPPVFTSSSKMPAQDFIEPEQSVATDPAFALEGGGVQPAQDNSATMGAVAKGLNQSSQSQGVGAMVGGTAGTGIGAAFGGPAGAAVGQSVGTMAGSLVDYFASAGDRARKAKAAEDAKIQAEKMRRMQEASQAKASMQADENRAMAMDDRTHNLDLQRQREQATVAQSVMNVIQNRDTARGLGGYGVNETARMGAAPILTPRKY